MFKPSTLLIAVVLSSTALWSGFVTGSISVTNALIRFLIAVPVAAAMTFAFRTIVDGYARRAAAASQAAAAEAAAEQAALAGLEGSPSVR